MNNKNQILIVAGAVLIVVGLVWFGLKQQGSLFTLHKPQVFSESQIAASPIEVGTVLGESEDVNTPTNPLEGIYVNPFSK